MYIKKCPCCHSSDVKKSGRRNNVQHYRCKSCGRQFQDRPAGPSTEIIWNEYLNAKQTIAEIASGFQISESTVKRILRRRNEQWTQPDLTGMSGFVHLDATYWGHNWGILLGLDDITGMVIYMDFIKHETTMSYQKAVDAITTAGYLIRGIVIDGRQELFTAFRNYPVQMCQFHMMQIVRRYLTKNPKMNASRELLQICRSMTYRSGLDFKDDYNTWKERWKGFLNKRTTHRDGKTYYLHRKIRTLVNSIDFYLPFLFTFQLLECAGMPNTNNKIEGTFTDLKKNLNNHSGLTPEHRRQFIIAYFQERICGQLTPDNSEKDETESDGREDGINHEEKQTAF